MQLKMLLVVVFFSLVLAGSVMHANAEYKILSKSSKIDVPQTQDKIRSMELKSGALDEEIIDVIIESSDASPIATASGEYGKFDHGNFYHAKILGKDIKKLEEINSVEGVWLQTIYRPVLDFAAPVINVSTFWNSGYNGTGVKVCVIDTGISWSNSLLYDNFSGSGLNLSKWNISCGDALGCVPIVGVNTTTRTFQVEQPTPHGGSATATYLNLIGHGFGPGETLDFDVNYSKNVGNQALGFQYDTLPPAPAFFLIGYWNGDEPDGNMLGLYHFRITFFSNKTILLNITKPDNSRVIRNYSYVTNNPRFYLSAATGNDGVLRADYDNFIISKTHPALASRVIDETDFTNSSNGAFDVYGHGTHVAGIVASMNSTYRGVAPGVSILNAKVLSDTGTGTVENVMKGVDWCISKGADIFTLSLGGPASPADGSDPLSKYLDLAVDQGKIVTVAAGNSGPGSFDSPCRNSLDPTGSSYSICSPGLSGESITVGSTQTGKSGTTKDAISSFSSRGPTTNGRIKPDVTAPGELITSTWKDGGYATLSGTSMSTPMVAGLAALILQTRQMSPAEVKALMMNTGVDLGAAGKDKIYGAGRINASAIFNQINNTIASNISNVRKVHNIFVPANSSIRATLYWPENYSVHNDVDLYLLDPSGNIMAGSNSSLNTDEIISYVANYSGYWKLLVDPFNVTLNQTYALAANFKPSGQFYMRLGNISSKVIYHTINASGPTEISLDWNGTSDIDLFLYNSTGSVVSSFTNNHENVSAPAGSYIVKILPKNLTGNVSYTLTSTFSTSGSFEDNTASSINLTGPLNITYSTNSILLNFSVQDNLNLPVNCISSLNDNVNQTTFFQSIHASQFTASEGTNTFYVTCMDNSNNTANASVFFSVDTTPPSVILVSPTNTSYVNNNISLNFSVSDIANCSYDLNGAVANVTGNTTILASVGLNTLQLSCSDDVGNIGSASVNFSVVVLPSSDVAFSGGNDNIFSPNGDGVYDDITINVTASSVVDFGTTYILDPNGTIVKFFQAVKNTSSIKKTWNGSSSFDLNITDGSYKIEIKINNTPGIFNSTNLTRLIVVDRTAPVVSFANPTPANGSVVNGSIIINVTTGENVTAVLEWNGINESMNGAGTSWFKTKTIVSSSSFRVFATDNAGNTNVSETRMVVANSTTFFDDLVQRMTLQNVTVTLLNASRLPADTNNLSQTYNYTLQFNSGSVLIEVEGFFMGQLGPADVNVTTAVNLTKIIGNFSAIGGVMDMVAWIDLGSLLPPGNYTAKIVFPSQNKIYFYLNGSKTDPIPILIGTCNATVDKPCYNDGTLYLPSFSGAAVGNDTQAPSISISSPIATTYSSSSIDLKYTVDDNVAVDKCRYVLNGVSTDLSSCQNTTITAAPGSNTLVLHVNDSSGNANSTSVTFTFTPPSAPPPPSESGGGGGSGIIVTAPARSNASSRTNSTNLTTSAAPAVQLCLENWVCNEWSECVDGVQTRTCVDTNDCGTQQNKLPESRACIAQTIQPAAVTGFSVAGQEPIIYTAIVIIVLAAGYLIWNYKFRQKRKRRPVRKLRVVRKIKVRTHSRGKTRRK